MPKGTEPTMGLVIKAFELDSVMKGLFQRDGSQGGIVQVHRDEVPSVITYPFIFLAEATESEDLRDSESVGGVDANHIEMLRVHCIAFAAGGDLPWKIVERARKLLIDENVKSAVLRADPDNDAEDIYDIRTVAESRQNLLPTLIVDEMARRVYQSTQTFLFYSKKKGGV